MNKKYTYIHIIYACIWKKRTKLIKRASLGEIFKNGNVMHFVYA